MPLPFFNHAGSPVVESVATNQGGSGSPVAWYTATGGLTSDRPGSSSGLASASAAGQELSPFQGHAHHRRVEFISYLVSIIVLNSRL